MPNSVPLSIHAYAKTLKNDQLPPSNCSTRLSIAPTDGSRASYSSISSSARKQPSASSIRSATGRCASCSSESTRRPSRRRRLPRRLVLHDVAAVASSYSKLFFHTCRMLPTIERTACRAAARATLLKRETKTRIVEVAVRAAVSSPPSPVLLPPTMRVEIVGLGRYFVLRRSN